MNCYNLNAFRCNMALVAKTALKILISQSILFFNDLWDICMYSWCLSQVSSFCKRGLESVSCTSFYSGQYILTYPCHYRMSMCTSSFIIDLRESFLYQSIDFVLFNMGGRGRGCHLLSTTLHTSPWIFIKFPGNL